MSKQHVAVPSNVFTHQGFLALPDVPYHSFGKKPLAIAVVFFRVCNVDIFNCVINQSDFYGSLSCSLK